MQSIQNCVIRTRVELALILNNLPMDLSDRLQLYFLSDCDDARLNLKEMGALGTQSL